MGILSAIQAIAALIGNGFKQYQDRKVAEHQVIIAQLEAQRQLAMAKEKAELELGKVQVAASSQLFKHLTFFMWFGPFIVTTVAPAYGVQIFENWKLMPEWYAQSCVALMFIIWGVQVGRAYIGNIFTNASAFFANRKKMAITRQLVLEAIRAGKHEKGQPLTQETVELIDKAFDRIEK